MKTERKYIFITGAGRSGTTLLQAMLHAHPEISFPPETHLIKKYQDPKSFLNAFADEQGTLHVGDKDPMITRRLHFLKKVCPHAYVIMVDRDIKDIISSRLKSGWGKRLSFKRHLAEVTYMLKLVRKQGHALFNERFIRITYEDLVREPEPTLKSLCVSLGLNYTSEMLNFHKTAATLIRDNEIDWKKNVLKPVTPSFIGKSETHLSERQLKMLPPSGKLPFFIKLYIELFIKLLRLKDGQT